LVSTALITSEPLSFWASLWSILPFSKISHHYHHYQKKNINNKYIYLYICVIMCVCHYIIIQCDSWWFMVRWSIHSVTSFWHQGEGLQLSASSGTLASKNCQLLGSASTWGVECCDSCG
jgi:hypothetical protein